MVTELTNERQDWVSADQSQGILRAPSFALIQTNGNGVQNGAKKRLTSKNNLDQH